MYPGVSAKSHVNIFPPMTKCDDYLFFFTLELDLLHPYLQADHLLLFYIPNFHVFIHYITYFNISLRRHSVALDLFEGKASHMLTFQSKLRPLITL